MENLPEGSYAISRRSLFEIWISEPEKDKKNVKMFSYVLSYFKLKDSNGELEAAIMDKIVKFGYKLSQKWKESRRTRERFLKNYETWLESSVTFSEVEPFIEDVQSQPSTSRGLGRPTKLFTESSDKTKRRKIKPLLETSTNEELVYATHASLHAAGKRDAAKMLKEMLTTSPKRATHIKKTFHSATSPSRKLSNEEALATYLDGKMTKRSYIAVQQRIKSVGSKVLPSYPFVLEAKKKCYPEGIVITETSAEVSLQSLIDHTTRRLCEVQWDILMQYADMLNDMELIFKWGCDGSSGLSPYKQRFTQENVEDLQNVDSAMFVISIVPLQLFCCNQTIKKILWQNSTASSTKYCRPIKLLLKSESAQLIKDETEKIEQQILLLSPVKLIVKEKEVFVKPKLLFTMVDGKICSSILDISSQKCYICGCSPKDMNNRSKLSTKMDNPESYRFGISPLHAKIRMFECLLKISYRLEVKKWQVRGKDKETVEKRKQEIQNNFRTKMGLLVDVVKQGFGTTNDGNTARRFFQDPALSSSITGIDETLITMFSILIQAISCEYEIDPEAFNSYALKALDRYLEHYAWYYMPPTVHKILVHGSTLIKHALLPIGQLAEDAQESRHKDIKKFRESHSRKYSRKATMEDVMQMLFITSDPVINSLRRHLAKPLKKLSPEVLTLLKSPNVYVSTVTADSSSDITSDDDYSSSSVND